MARSTFGGFGGDQVSLDPAGNSGFYKAAANYTTGTFWGTSTGTSTPYTDLIDPTTSVALTGVSTDVHGHVVPFKGPDGITEGWLDFGGGRFKVVATDAGAFVPSGTPAAFNLPMRDSTNTTMVWTTSQASVARALGWIVATDPAYGVVMDWAGGTTGTDNTAALQAAINAGPIVWLPSGYCRFTGNLTLGQHSQLMGAGWSAFGQENYGDPLWTSASGYTRYKGTVLYCSATSGNAITGDNASAGRWRLYGFMVIGPGSGTSTGISLCQTPSFNIRPNVRDVGVFNFSKGWAIGGTNEGQFDSMVAYACATGFSFGPNFNANTVTNIECQRSTVEGIVISGYGNNFDSGIVQNSSGTTGLHVAANSPGNTLGGNWYLENSTATDPILFESSTKFTAKMASNVTGMRITVGGCVLEGIYAPSTVLTMGTNLTKTTLVGCAFASITRNGSDIIDVSSRLSGTSSPTVGIGNDTPWQFERTDAQTSLRLKDTVNAHYIADFYPGTSDATSYVQLHAVFASGFSVSGSRPNAGNFAAGGMWFDTTLGVPIWTNGTAWRDAKGVATPLATKTANYTLVDGDGVVVFNGTSLTATLPDPTTFPLGRRLVVKNVNTSALTVASAGTSKTLDGAASQSLAQWAKAEYVSDGTQWLTV